MARTPAEAVLAVARDEEVEQDLALRRQQRAGLCLARFSASRSTVRMFCRKCSASGPETVTRARSSRRAKGIGGPDLAKRSAIT